jgi:dihydrofolate synthase/folylpolyglutamate synthase
MLGEHQKHNAGLAFAAFQAMQSFFPNLDVSQGKTSIKAAFIAGRLEVVHHQGHTFVLDAAHNAHAIQALLPTLQQMPPFDVIFLATREDRDLSDCLTSLQPLAQKIVKLTGDKPYDYPSVTHALDAEVSAYQGGHFLVLGSFLTLNETLNWFGKH